MSATAPPSPQRTNGPAAQPLVVKDVTTASFAADVIQESRKLPVLVDFWAPWCGPCKQLQPALEKVVAAAGGAVKLVKMNIDEHPAIAGQLGIQSIPAVIAFRNGQPVDGFMGAIPESQIRDFIQKLVGKNGGQPQIAEALAAAKQAREAGDLQAAADLYDAVLQEQPDNVEAIAGLADLLFEAGDKAGAEEVLARTPADKQEIAADRGREDQDRARRRGGEPRRSGCVRAPACRKPWGSSGALRPRHDPERTGQAPGGRRQSARHRQGGPHAGTTTARGLSF